MGVRKTSTVSLQGLRIVCWAVQRDKVVRGLLGAFTGVYSSEVLHQLYFVESPKGSQMHCRS